MSEPVGRLVAVVMFALAAGVAAAADPQALGDLSIDELLELRVEKVTTASKYEQKVTRAPAAVTVVTADTIRKSGYRTLAQILGSIRGLYVSDDHNYSYVGVRGFLRPGDYNGRVLLLVDGHRMNENVYDGAYIARESMVNVDLIERVEFIRGPGSSVYGSNAVFGVINVITRRGRDMSGPELSAEAGSLDSWLAELNYGRRFDSGLDLALSASNYDSAGQRRLYYPEFDPRISGDPRAADDGIAVDADGEDAQSFYAAGRYADWTLALFASSREKDVPTASYGAAFNDNRFRTIDRRVYADLKHERALGPGLQLLARASWDRYTFYADYPLDYAAPGDPPDVVVNTDEGLGEWATAELQLTGRLWERHTLLAGFEYRDNFRQDQVNYDARAPDARLLDAPHSSRVLGLYGQGEFALAPWLALSVGARFDEYYGTVGDTLNPRLGLVLDPWASTTFKVLYGSAYRAPNTYEALYYPAQAAQPRLEPERIRTYEFVAEQYFGHRYQISASVYHYDLFDLVTQTTDANGAIIYRNVDETQGRGVELEGRAQFGRGLEASASATLQRTEDQRTGQELSTSPRRLGKLRLVAPLYRDRVSGALELQYLGSMRTLRDANTESALTADLNLSARGVAPGLDLSAGVRNLLDESYAYPGSEDHLQEAIPQDGRSFVVKTTWRF